MFTPQPGRAMLGVVGLTVLIATSIVRCAGDDTPAPTVVGSVRSDAIGTTTTSTTSTTTPTTTSTTSSTSTTSTTSTTVAPVTSTTTTAPVTAPLIPVTPPPTTIVVTLPPTTAPITSPPPAPAPAPPATTAPPPPPAPAPPAPAPTTTAPPPPPAPSPSASISARAVELTNAQRLAAGLPALSGSGALDQAALVHSADQAAMRTMTHTGSDGSNAGQRIARAGFPAGAWGENVAAGQGSAADVINAWMNSPGHRDNILDPVYTHIAVAVANADDGTPYWTMVLAA